MNKEYMSRMSAEELDEFGASLGIVMTTAETVEDKIALIESRRERSATVRILGIDFTIAKKRIRDQRVVDLLSQDPMTDAQAELVMELMLGEKQMATLIEACTDEDGTVDAEALGVAFTRLIYSEELKNL